MHMHRQLSIMRQGCAAGTDSATESCTVKLPFSGGMRTLAQVRYRASTIPLRFA